ncbi:unnamed protein product [Gemmata massiliana]|uniref:Lipoprotein n=2 Tax=Gemmata massiliana TaxID=1210884 RepID=A0A6P2CVL8_9BACT|nr:unnamed protein product [Gemmata massiliana]
MVCRMRCAIVLFVTVVASGAGCFHANFAHSLKAPTPPSPLVIVTDDTVLHPSLGVDFALVLNVPADQRPSEAEVTFALVNPETKAPVRTARRTVAFGVAGRSEDLKDVFVSRCSPVTTTGEPLPKGEFVLVAALRVGGADLEARQRVEVREFERTFKSDHVPRGFIPGK